LKNRGRRRQRFPGTVVPAGGEEEAREHPGVRAHPPVAVACPETACGGLPTCAGELQRRTWQHGALRRVADKTERPVSITRSQGSCRNKQEDERCSVEVQPRWRRVQRPWMTAAAEIERTTDSDDERRGEQVKKVCEGKAKLQAREIGLSCCGDGAEEGKKGRATGAGLKRRGRARREHGHLLERATRSSTCPNARGGAELAKRCTAAHR
jgi:hypothetical protein